MPCQTESQEIEKIFNYFKEVKSGGFIKEEAIKINDLNVSLAEDQEFLVEILQDKMQTLVIDFNLEAEWFDDLTVSAVI